MWQAPNQRVRAIANAKKRERERARHPLHLKRVSAELRVASPNPNVEPQMSQGRVVLNDISPKGMGLFCTQFIAAGQEISLTLESPRRVYLKAKVVWCQEYRVDSHVLTQQSFSFRMGIQFIFQSKEEETAIKAFCEELTRDQMARPKSA